MLESDAWSDPQSDLTEELGVAPWKPAGGLNMASLGTDFAPARQRCVVPRVQPSQENGSDQRVPVYWDQTVPVWHAASTTTTTKRKSSASHCHGRGGQGRAAARWFESGSGAGSSSETAVSEENSGESNSNGGCSSGRGDGGAGQYSEVSFDAILAMYESSLVEKSFHSSRRDGWVFGALVTPRHDHARRRFWSWSTFAGRRPFPHLVSRAVELSPSGSPMIGALQVESVRRLQVAIGQTRICDPTSSPSCNNSHCQQESATFRGRRRSCDFQTHRLDALSLSTPMLTTSSS